MTPEEFAAAPCNPKVCTYRHQNLALAKAIEGLKFIESKEDEDGWDFPGTAREFLVEVQALTSGDSLVPLKRELRAIIGRAKMNARLEERRRIVVLLRNATDGVNATGAAALLEAARAIEDDLP